MEKSLGVLVDELTIVNIKIFFCVDIIEKEKDPLKVAEAARKAQSLNSQRSKLKNAIDALVGNTDAEIKL